MNITGRRWDCIDIQRHAIYGILEKLSLEDRMILILDEARTRTGLEDAIQAYKEENLPNMIHTRTMRRWMRHYFMFLETPIETYLHRRRFRTRRNPIWVEQDTTFLREILNAHPEYYLDEIQNNLYLVSGKWFSCKTIYKHMKRLNYSLKVAYEKALQRDETERASWRLFLNELGPDIAQSMIFVDETHKSLKEMRRRRHWVVKTMKHQPFFTAAFYGERDMRYSMIGACDISGFVLEACEVIQTDGSGPDVGPINRDRFEQWIRERLLLVLGNFDLREPRSLVILDNATIHHSDEIVHLIDSVGAKIAYLSPYSPDLNPIELMFSSYKKSIKQDGTKYGWLVSHCVTLSSVRPSNARNFFRHCDIPVHEDNIDDKSLYTAAALVVILLLCLTEKIIGI